MIPVERFKTFEGIEIEPLARYCPNVIATKTAIGKKRKMINNQTIDLIRNLLDEHDIEYTESQDQFRTKFHFNYCESCGDYLNEIEVMGACITASKSYLTPEQAIAVTLGRNKADD